VTRGPALVLALLLTLAANPAHGQDEGGLATRNPLDEIRDELIRVLAEAELPFTPDQERSITLVLEESRRASEQLFGQVMNFSGGPPQGEQLDRARAGIAWMNDDFSQRVREFLTPAQLVVWDAHNADEADEAEGGTNSAGTNGAGTSEQVQQIRVNNNNAFTAENQYQGQPWSGGSYASANGGGVQAQIIQRGGTGAWHGNFQFRFRDEALNARNPFASNRPPYQQQNINLNVSGPLIRNRLTVNGGFNQSMQDNAETVNADTPEGKVQIGFTRELVFRNAFGNGTLQLADDQSLHFNGNLQRYDAPNQAVGGFTLPERGISYLGGNGNVRVRHVWFASHRLVQDISFATYNNHQDAVPETSAVSVNVLGAFNGGGGANVSSRRNGGSDLNLLWIYTRAQWTIRTGGLVERLRTNETSRSNFNGTFTFSDLDAFVAGTPILYKVTQGDPALRNILAQSSVFIENQWRVSTRLSLFFGVRYERQTHLEDENNIGPRVSVAYALGNSTVIRAGTGLFHARVGQDILNTLARLDGTRQHEIVISDPSYPDPFQSGDVTVVPPASRRVRANDLVAPESINSSVQLEQSLPGNLFVTVSYDHHRGYHQLRSRDLNAPAPGDTARPDPATGSIWRLESTGRSAFRAIRLTMRQRFSIFNVNANYSREVDESDTLGAFGAPTDNHDLRSDLATVVRHQFNVNVNARLPLGVFLATNVASRNGNPYTITTGLDNNGDGVTNDRPPGVPRNSERGPAFSNISFNVSKAFEIRASSSGGAPMNVNVFANVSNAFNHTNFGTPIGVQTSPLFGQPISAFNPREIEIGLRFQF
jgi:hypothetical protein